MRIPKDGTQRGYASRDGFFRMSKASLRRHEAGQIQQDFNVRPLISPYGDTKATKAVRMNMFKERLIFVSSMVCNYTKHEPCRGPEARA